MFSISHLFSLSNEFLKHLLLILISTFLFYHFCCSLKFLFCNFHKDSSAFCSSTLFLWVFRTLEFLWNYQTLQCFQEPVEKYFWYSCVVTIMSYSTAQEVIKFLSFFEKKLANHISVAFWLKHCIPGIFHLSHTFLRQCQYFCLWV